MKKFLAILLTLCLVVCMIPGAAFADTATSEAGLTADNPIKIDSYATFNATTFTEGKYYKQTASFSITNGYTVKALAGNYDGGEYTITLDDENLFGTVSGTVKNLKVVGTSGKAVSAKGAIATTNNGTIEDCTVSNITLTPSSNDAIGAVAGTSTGTIKNCTASGIILKNEQESDAVVIGGLVGTASGTVECGSISGITFTAKANEGNKIGSVVGTASGELTIVSAKEVGAYPIIAEGSTGKVTVASSGALNNALNIGAAEINNTTVKKLTGTTVDLNSATVTELITTGSNPVLSMASSKVTTLTLNAATTIDSYTGNSHIGTINCGNTNTPTVSGNTNLKIDKCVFKNTTQEGLANAAKLFDGDSSFEWTLSGTGTSEYTYTYTPVYVATIGTQSFYSLSDAIEYALANSGKTIKLLKDATIDSITVQNGTAVTIDANGKNLTITSVTNYGSLVVTDTATTKGKITINDVASGSNKFCGTGNYANDPTDYALSGYTCKKVTPTSGPAYWQIDDLKKDISKLTVTLSDNTMAYTGYQLKPTVTVKDGTKTISSIYYDVTYGTNIGSSTTTATGTVTVTFKDTCPDYRGTKTLSFTITPGKVLSTTTVYIPAIADQTYTGTYIKPYISVYYGGTTSTTARTLLTENVHYTLSYSSNINAGTATVTATAKAGSGYSGSVSKTFNIKYNLSNATVTTTPAAYAYDGRAKQPTVTVKVGYATVPTSDYIVTYSNNINAGTATATVTARTYGTSMGSNTAYFTITGKTGAITPEYAAYNKKTTKSSPFAIRIISNTTDGTGYSYTSSDTSVATVSALGTVTVKGCGKTVITITTTGNRAYNPATTTVTVTVKPTKGIITSLKSTAKGKMVVKYKKESPNADYYQIRYGRAGDYTVKTVKNSTALTGKSTIKNLKSGKKYYVKVRGVKELADGTVLYGSWSTAKNVVTK